jgi:hypothetical protein
MYGRQESLKRIVRSVFMMAADCGLMTPEELGKAEPGTLDSLSRDSLERLAEVARVASEALKAESARR